MGVKGEQFFCLRNPLKTAEFYDTVQNYLPRSKPFKRFPNPSRNPTGSFPKSYFEKEQMVLSASLLFCGCAVD